MSRRRSFKLAGCLALVVALGLVVMLVDFSELVYSGDSASIEHIHELREKEQREEVQLGSETSGEMASQPQAVPTTEEPSMGTLPSLGREIVERSRAAEAQAAARARDITDVDETVDQLVQRLAELRKQKNAERGIICSFPSPAPVLEGVQSQTGGGDTGREEGIVSQLSGQPGGMARTEQITKGLGRLEEIKDKAQNRGASHLVGSVPKSAFAMELEYEERDIPCMEVWDERNKVRRCLPNAVIAGFPKCGTSQLRQDLGRCHPQILSARGEPSSLILGKMWDYLDHLPVVLPGDNQLFLEASPNYSKATPRNLHYAKQLLPHAKIIFLVRNPVERLYSHFRMHLRNGKLDKQLAQRKSICVEDTSLCLEKLLVFGVLTSSGPWRHCVEQSYGSIPRWENVATYTDKDMAVTEHWTRCIEAAPNAQPLWLTSSLSPIVIPSYVDVIDSYSAVYTDVLVIRSEDFFTIRDHSRTVTNVLSFLGVDPNEKIVDCFAEEGNSKVDKNKEQEEELHIHVTPISPRLYTMLQAIFAADTEKLEEKLARSLAWFDSD